MPFISNAAANSAVKTVPAIAAGAGFNNLIFFDDFKSTSNIDMAQTNNPGFTWYKSQWYKHSAWPSPAADNNVSINGGELVIVGHTAETDPDPGNGVYGYRARLGTAQSISSNTSYIGRTFSSANGFYVECKMRFDPTQCPGTQTGWPGFWMNDTRIMLNGTTGEQHVELDGFEPFPNGVGAISPFFATHEWVSNGNGSATATAWSPAANYDQTSAMALLNPVYTNYNKYSFLLTTMAQGAGTGALKKYFNGTELTTGRVTWTSGGHFSSVENGNYVLFIEGGTPGWPGTFDYIAVWGP